LTVLWQSFQAARVSQSTRAQRSGTPRKDCYSRRKRAPKRRSSCRGASGEQGRQSNQGLPENGKKSQKNIQKKIFKKKFKKKNSQNKQFRKKNIYIYHEKS
jgi:hypothetical protein